MSKNRDAGDSFKGLTLQKARTVYSLLKSINMSNGDAKYFYVYGAIEADDDVNILIHENGQSENILEQNKNTQNTKNLTFNSTEVKKSIINFIDNWIYQRESNSVKFIFYSTSGIGKENETDLIKQLNLSLPKDPILNILMIGKFDDDFLNKFLIPYIIEFYIIDYKDNDKNNLSIIQEWECSDWRIFLNQIKWFFISKSTEEIDNDIIDEIRKCSFYNSLLINKEKLIAARIEQELERRMANQDFPSRFINLSDIKLFFKEAEPLECKQDDCTGELLAQIDINDTRNISEKIESTCEFNNIELISFYKLKASEALLEEKAQNYLRPYTSQKYQIYTAVNEYLVKNKSIFMEITEIELIKEIDKICEIAIKRIQVERKDFIYPLRNDISIKNIVYGLLDQCYIAFNERSHNGS